MIKRVKSIFSTKFGKDVMITIFGQIIVLIVAFGLNKVLSVRLGTAGFGEYNIIKRTTDIITYIMLTGMGIAIPKYLATHRERGDKETIARYTISGLLIITLLSLILIIVLLLLRVSFAQILFGTNGYDSYIPAMLLYAFSLSLTNFAYSYFRGMDSFYKYNLTQIIVQLVTLILAIIFGGNVLTLIYVWGLVIGCYGIYTCLSISISHYQKANIKLFKMELKPYIKELASFCIPRIPGEFILFGFTGIPLILINKTLGIETTAYFSVAISINTLINPFFSFVGLVLLPLVSKSVVSNEFSAAVKKVKVLGVIYFLVATLAILFIVTFTPFVINILFSPNFLPSIPIIHIMILAVLPNAFYLLLRNPLDAVSKTPYNTINLGISFLVLIILTLLSSDSTGYAYSFLAAYSLLGILTGITWYRCCRNG
jgi:O-antigen/teichoic acid export membrane protein